MNDRLEVSAATVAELVASQFPDLAPLPVQPVAWSGWDNRTFRLGAELKVRLPSAERYVAAVEKEQRWLPLLAPHLPLPIPAPLRTGKPGNGYPFIWSIQSWLGGEPVTRDAIGDGVWFARDLGGFLKALQAVDSTGGPLAGRHNFHRGGDLAVYEHQVFDSIARLGSAIDAAGAHAVWAAARTSRWEGAPVWVHGDVAVGNLLVSDGRLSAVIDFGGLGVGDPASDLVIAWLLFEGASRDVFQETIGGDAGLWARARGWALWKAMLMMLSGQALHPAELPAAQVVPAVIADHYSSGSVVNSRG